MRSGIGLLLIAALAIGGCDRASQDEGQAAPSVAAGEADRSHKGTVMPDVAFTNPSGEKTTLAAFRGKPLLVNLWATWCAPCIAEMPTLDKLAVARGDALRVLVVSQDLGGAAQVRPFFAKNDYIALQPYLDPDLNLSLAYGANLPTTILYDAAGREVWRVTGGLDWTGDKAAKLLAEGL